jgi:FMN-dependent NADH-azoreductase
MNVLFVNSSPRQDDSESIPLAESVLASVTESEPETAIDRIDVFEDLPLYDRNGVDAKMKVFGGQDLDGTGRREWDRIEELAGRLRAADTIVFTVPVWNHTVNWGLKMFIDTVTQPGLVFDFDPEKGYTGLLGGKRAIVIYTGSVWSPGAPREFGLDLASGYFEYWLEFAGIDQVDVLRLQPTYGDDLPERREVAMARAVELGRDIASIDDVAGRDVAAA